MSCEYEDEKPAIVSAVLRTLQPKAALLFLADDTPLRATVDSLQSAGINAVALHEAMGLEDGSAPAVAGCARLLAHATCEWREWQTALISTTHPIPMPVDTCVCALTGTMI